MNIQTPFSLLKVQYFYLSELIYFVHLDMADPVDFNIPIQTNLLVIENNYNQCMQAVPSTELIKFSSMLLSVRNLSSPLFK